MIFGVPAVSSRFAPEVDYIARLFGEATNQLAAVILSHNSKSVADIQSHYDSSLSPVVSVTTFNSIVPTKVRILIVPGHEPDYGGAEYESLKERNMTVELAQDLSSFLNSDSHYQTFITRDTQEWSPDFAAYFKNNWNDIVAWEKASFQDVAHRISIGSSTKTVPAVVHRRVPNEVATRLYGITKWANENDIDITIHIHFNDSPDHPGTAMGTHTGFTIYIPEHQYTNGTSSRAVAETIFKRLSKYNPVSDLKGESAGLVEDQDLIAIGANDTASAASVLIEYGYIYEPQFVSDDTRSLALKDLAYQTYLGLQDFFIASSSTALDQAYDTVALPHSWIRVISGKNTQNADVFALQTALFADGEYPPATKSLSDCPRTGSFGACTREALQVFQKKYGIVNEKNAVGEKTLQLLNQNYGTRAI